MLMLCSYIIGFAFMFLWCYVLEKEDAGFIESYLAIVVFSACWPLVLVWVLLLHIFKGLKKICHYSP